MVGVKMEGRSGKEKVVEPVKYKVLENLKAKRGYMLKDG